MDIRRVVGGNVRRARVAAGFSQEALAALLGVDQAYISRFEAGKLNPTIVTIWHAAEALGVQPASLFEQSRRKRARATKEDAGRR